MASSDLPQARAATPLDFAFVLWLAWQTGIDQKAIVLGTFPISLLHGRIFLACVRVDDRGFEVVQYDALRHAAEKLEGVLMTQQPRRQFLIKHDLGVLMST